jgi:DNA repair exonuclease SbcCD ATPase subunit
LTIRLIKPVLWTAPLRQLAEAREAARKRRRKMDEKKEVFDDEKELKQWAEKITTKEKEAEQLKAKLEIEEKYSWGIKLALGLITNIINPDENEFKKHFPEGVPHDVNQIMKLYEDKKITKAQLAEKEKEIGELKKRIEEIKKHWAEDERMKMQYHDRIESLESSIEKAIINLNQTKKFFKSKTIAEIRKKLIERLPLEKQTKFICLGCGLEREKLED